MTTEELDKQRDKVFNEYYASLIELISSAKTEHPAIGQYKLDVGLKKITNKLISDCIDAVTPPYRDEGTERDRGNNDVLDVIATRKRNLLGEK